MKKCLEKKSLGLLVTKESCSLEHSVSRVCGGLAEPLTPVGQLFTPGKQKWGIIAVKSGC